MDSNITIPQGNSSEEIKQREKIIRDFYRKWKKENPSQRRYNLSLKEYINIRMVSIIETSEHAAKSIFQLLRYCNLMQFLLEPKKFRSAE